MEQGGSRAVQLVVQLVLARILTPNDFGVLSILLVAVQVADAVAQGGMGQALIQRREVSGRDYDTAFWLTMGLAAALYAVLFLLAPAVSWFYDMDSLSPYLRVLSLVLFLDAANSIQRSYLQRALDFKSLFKTSLAAVGVSGFAGIWAALAGWGVWALVVQTIVMAATNCVAMGIVVPWRPAFHFDMVRARELFAFGWEISATGVLNVLYSGLSDLIIGKSCSPTQLGYYSQGKKWPSAAASVITNSIQNVMFPLFARCSHDVKLLRERVLYMTRAGSFLLVPFCVFCAVAARPLVSILLTDKWLASVPVFALAALGVATNLVTSAYLRAYMALGLSDLYLRLQLIKVSAGIVVLSVTALLSRNIYVVAVAWCLLSTAFSLVVDLAPSRRVLGIRRTTQLAQLAPLSALACLAGVAAWGAGCAVSSPLLTLAVEFAVYALVYLGASHLLRLQAYGDCRAVLARALKRRRGSTQAN